MTKKYHLITYGCQMNKSDSERIAAILQNIGYKKAINVKQADLIIVNMCSVRQSAVDRIFGLNEKFKELKQKNPELKIGLTGCLLNDDCKKLTKIFDFIFNIKDTPKLKKILRQKIFNLSKSPSDYLSIRPKIKSNINAYVPIMTGCNNFCAYCVVPYTRQREFSRPAQEIIKEIEFLIAKKYKEIILLGQNVNSYQDKDINFPKLLQIIDNLPGNFWLNFVTSHPKDLSDELINTIVNSQKICRYLHLPVQSGDNQILQKMNRGYTIEKYKTIIKKIRKKDKNISISTDIIVGFPGETKKQFKKTVKLLKQVKFDMVYIAQYSPRPGTKAAEMEDNVPKEEKKEREEILNKILKKTALKKNKKLIGQTVEILIENCKNNQYYGKTKNIKNVKIISPDKKSQQPPLSVGQFIKIKIIKATPWGLKGLPC